MPKNISPHNLNSAKFTDAKVHQVHLGPGDCMYVPNYWWVQVSSSETELTVGVTHWYEVSSTWVDLIMKGIRSGSL